MPQSKTYSRSDDDSCLFGLGEAVCDGCPRVNVNGTVASAAIVTKPASLILIKRKIKRTGNARSMCLSYRVRGLRSRYLLLKADRFLFRFAGRFSAWPSRRKPESNARELHERGCNLSVNCGLLLLNYPAALESKDPVLEQPDCGRLRRQRKSPR